MELPSPDKFHVSLKAKGKGAKDWANSWTEVEHLGDGKFAASISVGHKVFKDKVDGQWKKHKLTDERSTKDYVLIQSAKCCVEVYPYYAKYFDVDHEEVRLYEERWVVQRLFQEPDKWRDVGAYNPVISVDEYSEPAGDVVKVTITYDTDYGVLNVEYFQRDGNDLKHNVIFQNTSGGEETFRVLQRWAGIVGEKCNGKDIPVVEDAFFFSFHKSDKPDRKFNIAENLWSMVFNPDGSEKTDQCLQRPVSVESHAQGMKADFIYAQWVLAQDESLEIDPATATLNNPTVDGQAAWDEDDTQDYDTNVTGSRIDYGKDTAWVYERFIGFSEWSLLGLPDAITVSDSVFKYHCTGRDQWGNIYEMASRPWISSAQTIYNDALGGTLYVSSGSATFPTVGTNQQIDLGASADSLIESRAASGDWFAIGLSPPSFIHGEVTWIGSEEKSGVTPPPTLYIVYTEEAPPDPPTNVQATDGVYFDKVVITWTGSEGATGYQVYRDGTPLGWLGEIAIYNDYGAGAPSITLGNAVASDGGYTGYVALSLSGTGTNNGATHTYKVKARNAAGESGFSGTDTGYRKPGTLYYQWYKSMFDSDDTYAPIGGATSSTYNDTEAPAPTVTPGTASASDGIYTGYTRLTLAGESANIGAGRYYKCYLTAAGCAPGYASSNRGYRGVGSITYQWYKSAGDSDASYSSISGGTTDPYNYTEAPAPTITPGTASASDGTFVDYVRLTLAGESANVGAGRYYKCLVSATGAASQYSTSNRGYRGVGSLTYQWRRSAADSDADFSNITGATTDPYNDTGAPANGDGRWYYCRLSATGAASQDSTHNRGYRDVVGVDVDTMIGGPTGWVWGNATGGETVPITTDGGLTFTWGTIGPGDVVPDGGPTGWTWVEA